MQKRQSHRDALEHGHVHNFAAWSATRIQAAEEWRNDGAGFGLKTTMKQNTYALTDPEFRRQIQALKDVTAEIHGEPISPVVFSIDRPHVSMDPIHKQSLHGVSDASNESGNVRVFGR